MIGIITAELKELEAIKSKMKVEEEKIIYQLTFFLGKIGEKECVLVQGRVGKVNAARTAQILIDHFPVTAVINIGVAGSLNEILKIGDIVIGEELIQHDFDVTAFGHEKGYISDTGKVFESNKKLINLAQRAKEQIQGKYSIKKGVIASGDIFCTSKKMKEKIKEKFGADCVEMEGAAIAQVCFLDQIPFLVIRSISDSPNEENQIDFEKFIELAAQNVSELLEKMLSLS